MDKNNFFQGGHPFRLDDMVHLQNGIEANVLHWARGMQAPNDNFILEGCIITQAGGNENVTAGSVVLNGEIFPVEAHAIPTVGGEVLHWVIVETFTPINPRAYENAVNRDVNAVRRARLAFAPALPAGGLIGNGISFEELQERFAWNVGDIKESTVALTNFNGATFIGIGRKYRNWKLCFGADGGAPTVFDFKRRVGVGLDLSNNPFDTKGFEGGEENQTLQIAQMPAHSHVYSKRDFNAARGTGVSGNVDVPTGSNDKNTQNTGGAQSHNNMQPFIVIVKMQKIS